MEMCYRVLKAKLPLILLLMAMMLVSASVAFIPSAYSASRPVIYSKWTDSPPVIDGNFMAGEWANLQIFMTLPDYPIDAYVYFLNDNSNLYVLADSVGDTTDDANDECLLVFNYEPLLQKEIEIIGQGGKKSGGDYIAAVGYSSSPNSINAHKIYEFSIPLSYINAEPGKPIDFSSPKELKPGSMTYDASDGRDNVWPAKLELGNIDTWGIILFAPRPAPVGGVLMPVNKLAILAPYIALSGLVAIASTACIIRKKPKY